MYLQQKKKSIDYSERRLICSSEPETIRIIFSERVCRVARISPNLKQIPVEILEIWQKSGDCEREIVQENLVGEVGGDQIQSDQGQFCEQMLSRRKVEIQLE